jgi:hypothetical protein
MILGYPFLIGTNPPMDWKKGKLYGTVAAFAPGHEAYSEGADQVCLPSKQNKKTRIGRMSYHLTITPLGEYSVKKIANDSPIQNHGTTQ